MHNSWAPLRPTTLSKHHYSFNNADAGRRGCSSTLRGTRIKRLGRGRPLCTASLDPWKTLGVPHDADENAIKKAYRKLALQNHPDLKGSQAANRFVKIQEAYEVVTGKRRGSTVEDTQQPAKAGSWDFHDWYWKFTVSKRWDQQKHKKPSSSAPQPPRPTGAPQAALQEQLAGLRRKAAYRRVNRRAASESVPQEAYHSAPGTPTSPYTQPAQQASGAALDSFHQAHSSSSGSNGSSHEHLANAQLAGLKRRAAIRMKAQQPPEASPAPDQGHPVGDAQDVTSNAAAADAPLHASPASKDAHVADLHQKHAASVRHRHPAAAAASASGARSSTLQQSLREADTMQEANGAVPWRRQRSAARSSSAGASALRMSVVGHPLADIDIMKCMREISSHLSWR
ncbi:g6368 [Coccomyxa viridis]|uniref:G6368 protein n=1 Tax=Coccomyxa viridis TaxID=1274662 RepID=A0ABP1G1S5_9CHLO